jgi:hypothetical protein
MASTSGKSDHRKVMKRTSQGGSQPKTASMNKVKKNSFKAYRGQGK